VVGVLVGLWWVFLGCLLGWGVFCVVTVIVFRSFAFCVSYIVGTCLIVGYKDFCCLVDWCWW